MRNEKTLLDSFRLLAVLFLMFSHVFAFIVPCEPLRSCATPGLGFNQDLHVSKGCHHPSSLRQWGCSCGLPKEYKRVKSKCSKALCPACFFLVMIYSKSHEQITETKGLALANSRQLSGELVGWLLRRSGQKRGQGEQRATDTTF